MTPLDAILRREIEQRGPLPFAEFMHRALYDPALGYYARVGRQIGRGGDFITSVSVGPLFGELLAFQFARWCEALSPAGAPVQWIEAGAHDGQLAEDLLQAVARHEPGLLRRLEYWIIEPSPERRTAQQARLASFSNVRWQESLPAKGSVRGVIFSNELLDALPVHPFVWDAKRRGWLERGVGCTQERLVWTPLSHPTIPAPELPPALLDVLPHGYIVEQAPDAARWWHQAAQALASGWLVTIDYGGTMEELLSPGHASGTLRAYARHRVSDQVLDDPGEQDITAHVNFTAVCAAGEGVGLRTRLFAPQSQFLTRVMRELWERKGTWPVEKVRQFQTLTHPEHLGRPFRVLVQERN